MKTIKDAWESYRTGVIPATAGRMQLQECRRAFYSGAWAFLQMQIHYMAAQEDEKALDIITAWNEECKQFAKDVEEGRA